MYQVTNINDLELLYSLLREKFPDNEILIEFDFNSKEYSVSVTKNKFICDPKVPLDLTIKVIYGDSVTGHTPLLLRDPYTKKVHIKTIQSLIKETEIIDYPEFKMFDQSIRLEKTYSKTHYEVWTDDGWNPIKKVIRHKTHKKIYKILTHTGMVEVTEDHSLLDENCQIIKPNKCNLNTKLLNSYPTESDFKSTLSHSIPKSEAAVYGFLYGDGNLYIDENPDEFIDKYRSLFYDNNKNKRVPTELLNSDNKILRAFFDGYLLADSCKKDQFASKSQLVSAGLYFIMKRLGYNISLNVKNNMLKTCVKTQQQEKFVNQIKKIDIQDYGEIYVYDLETDIGRFNAGVGDIQVKNTDSIFISFKYNRDNFEKNRSDTFKMATLCGDNITEKVFDRPPICLEFEKVFQPFILLTKKRYIGKKFEDVSDPFKLKTTTTAGIAVTRRDFANFTKKCYKEVIDIIMENKVDALENACEVYRRAIDRLDAYQVDLDDIIISAQIGKEYSCKTCKKKVEWVSKCDKCKTLNPMKHLVCQGEFRSKPCKKVFECVHTFSLGHINLAQRQLTRNEEVQVGDRIQYIFVESENINAQKNELAEDPVYAQKNNIKFNRGCYIEQLGKTLLAFFKITLAQRNDLLDDIINFTNDKLTSYGNKKLKPSDFKIDEES